jgi:hypothetical protein
MEPVERIQLFRQPRIISHRHELLVIADRESALAGFNHDFLEDTGERERHRVHVILDRGRTGVRVSRSRIERRTLRLTASSLLWSGSPMMFPSDGHISDRTVEPSAGHADVCLL